MSYIGGGPRATLSPAQRRAMVSLEDAASRGFGCAPAATKVRTYDALVRKGLATRNEGCYYPADRGG